MLNNPLVSIVMPVFNAEKYIVEAISSALNQDHKNIELIIINDGSTDSSNDIIVSFKDTRIRYFEQNNKGVSNARNYGLQQMKGAYFCFLDADDLMPKNSIKSRLDVFLKDDSLSFVDGNVAICSEDLKKTFKLYKPSFLGIPTYELISLSGRCFVGQTWLIKSSNEIIPFKENLTHGEDLLFFIQNSFNKNYSYCDELILYYRQNFSSAMKNIVGLEKGYEIIWEELKSMKQIPLNWTQYFREKTKRILFKSYLKNKEFIKAFKVLIKK